MDPSDRRDRHLKGWMRVAGYQDPAPEWTPAAGLTSVGWLYVRDGQVLGVRTRGRDRFYLPGGKPEPGESHQQALEREVREELGVQLREVRPAFTVTAPAHGLAAETLLTMHCFHGNAGGHPQPGAEIDELAWLDISGDDRAAPAVRAVLDRLTSSP
jgi:8-oxo-dGTP diphosphatase